MVFEMINNFSYTSPDFVQLLGTPYIHYVVPFYDLYVSFFPLNCTLEYYVVGKVFINRGGV